MEVKTLNKLKGRHKYKYMASQKFKTENKYVRTWQ